MNVTVYWHLDVTTAAAQKDFIFCVCLVLLMSEWAVTVYFSCIGFSCKAVYLWSSRISSLPSFLSILFREDKEYLFVSGWTIVQICEYTGFYWSYWSYIDYMAYNVLNFKKDILWTTDFLNPLYTHIWDLFHPWSVKCDNQVNLL